MNGVISKIAGLWLLLFLASHQYQANAEAGETYSAEQLSRFETLKLTNPIQLEEDPYDDNSDVVLNPFAAVCAAKFDGGAAYSLHTFPSSEAAAVAGASVTHFSACGTCSTFQDLAAYLRHRDMTTPVRRCALLSFHKGLAMNCLNKIGFTDACAQTWFYNARNTARSCKAVCLKVWLKGEPNNKADGNLNACLACDESVSGTIFKQVAGRTRRNSGITSAIGRGDQELVELEHNY